MELKEAIYKLRKYPKVLVQFLRDAESPYLSIYQISRLTGIDYSTAKGYVYDLISDGILIKYQTTFKMSESFTRLRPNL